MSHLSLEQIRKRGMLSLSYTSHSHPPFPVLSGWLSPPGLRQSAQPYFGAIHVKTLQYPSGRWSGYTTARPLQRSLSKMLNESPSELWNGQSACHSLSTPPSVNVTCLLSGCIPECWAHVGRMLVGCTNPRWKKLVTKSPMEQFIFLSGRRRSLMGAKQWAAICLKRVLIDLEGCLRHSIFFIN